VRGGAIVANVDATDIARLAAPTTRVHVADITS
jgi:hypothetical protein